MVDFVNRLHVNPLVKNLVFKRIAYYFGEHYLSVIVSRVKPHKIMEIGVYRGDGAAKMIKAALESGVKNVDYYGFDLFGKVPDEDELSPPPTSIYDMETIRRNLSKFRCRVHLFAGNTRIVLPRLVDRLPKMDFVYIDGGHSYETVKSDWENTKKLMHQGTVVIFDDWRIKGVGRVIDEIGDEFKTIMFMNKVIVRWRKHDENH